MDLSWITSLVLNLFGQQQVATSYIYAVFCVVCVLSFFSLLRYKFQIFKAKRQFKHLYSHFDGKDSEELTHHIFASSVSQLGKINNRLLLSKWPSPLDIRPAKSRWRMMAGVLTSLGVLGTFIGIVKGLDGINLNGASEDVFNSVVVLISGMGTAFYTSLVGILTSILLLFWLGLLDYLKRSWFDSTLKFLEARFRLETPSDYLFKMLGVNQDDMIAQQKEANESLIGMSKTLEKAANSFDADKIGEHISNKLDNVFSTKMVPVFEDINKELSELRAIKQDNGEKIIQAIMTQLRTEVIQPLSNQISETSELVKESTKSVNQLNSELGDVAKKLAGAVSTIQTFQKETLTQLSEFSVELKNILKSFQSDTKQILSDVSLHLEGSVNKSIEAMDSQKNAFENSAIAASNTFKGIREDLESSLDKQAGVQKGMLDETANRITVLIDEFKLSMDMQTSVVKEAGDNAAKLMDSSRESLESTLSNVDNVLIKTKDVIEQELHLFRDEYQNNLKQFFEQQNNLLEGTLGAQRNGLSSVVERCNEVFEIEYQRRLEIGEKLTSSIGEIEQSVKTVSELVETVGLLDSAHFNQIEQTAKTIGRQVSSLEKNYTTSSELFSELLSKVPEELNSYFDRANKTHEEFFKDMDEASAKIHERLLQSAEYLISSEHQRRIMKEAEAV